MGSPSNAGIFSSNLQSSCNSFQQNCPLSPKVLHVWWQLKKRFKRKTIKIISGSASWNKKNWIHTLKHIRNHVNVNEMRAKVQINIFNFELISKWIEESRWWLRENGTQNHLVMRQNWSCKEMKEDGIWLNKKLIPLKLILDVTGIWYSFCKVSKPLWTKIMQ